MRLVSKCPLREFQIISEQKMYTLTQNYRRSGLEYVHLASPDHQGRKGTTSYGRTNRDSQVGDGVQDYGLWHDWMLSEFGNCEEK